MASPRPETVGTNRRSRRWVVFVYQDGVLLCSGLRALAEFGILDASLAAERSVADLCPRLTNAGFGYLRVGLRALASQGWIADGPTLDAATTRLRWTDAGRSAMRHRDHYLAAGRFLAGFASNERDFWTRPWTDQQIDSLLELVPLAGERWRLDAGLPPMQRPLIEGHLDAALVVPVMLWLLNTGRLDGDGPALPEGEFGDGIERLLTAVGWLDERGRRWNEDGRTAADVAVHFGMAASYLPLLARLPELWAGELRVVDGEETREWHVHRALNVIASAAAHKRYFSDADQIFVDLFNREPIETQPRFIADTGCGDGSWLVHLYRLITEHTLRGTRIASSPLMMVGIDYNQAALGEAERVLDEAGVPAILIRGDISDPASISSSLAEAGLAMEDGLHIRAFIDHNRSYVGGGADVDVAGSSTGAYVNPDGSPLSAAEVERDLVVHLRRWAPHVHKHGVVILEAHCVAPQVARRHLGATHSVAFDAYHGYSLQYPIGHPEYRRCCREAGLQPATHSERRYPATRPFVAVSLNRLLVSGTDPALPAIETGAARTDTWRPDPSTDLEDGRALHALMYVGGDMRYPRGWCSAPTGAVVAETMGVVRSRLAACERGDVIRVLDYGAGTGFATLELLKGCLELDIESQLEAAGAKLELHLVDIPSSWYAQGYELLRPCAWTSFHSLRSEGGGFRPLIEVTGGRRMDAVMANMVFHLVPEQALPRVAAELAAITVPGGRLLWNSPDLGPSGPYAVLFHDANRALRARWLALLSDEHSRLNSTNGSRTPSPRLLEALREVRAGLTPERSGEAQTRAARRVLPVANQAGAVANALDAGFAGDSTIDFPTHEILRDDLVDTLLVPSNQAEYLSEIPDRGLREDVIRELMLDDVLPAMQEQAAGTSLGLNVQWTVGSVTKPCGG